MISVRFKLGLLDADSVRWMKVLNQHCHGLEWSFTVGSLLTSPAVFSVS